METFGGLGKWLYFCTRFWEIKHCSKQMKKEFFERFNINRQVVQEAVLITPYYIGCMRDWVKETNRQEIDKSGFRTTIEKGWSSYWQNKQADSFLMERWSKKIFYNGEFDPGSGWTLATGLTHASRGAAGKEARFITLATGARVSNAYPTCPPLGNNLAKVRLMPNDVECRHLISTKDSSVTDGDASD